MAPTPAAPRRPTGALFAGILLATLAAYLPSLPGGFLWDDAGHVTAPALQSWAGLLRIWFEPGATQQYYPLLHSAFWLEHRLWGDATLGYHLVNVLWHALSACLLVAVLRRLAVPGAVLAGLVFALHPVGVESVAWISEQKNTLSTVFYLLAALAYLRFDEERRPGRYAVAFLWFGAALLTKSVAATLPGALLVIGWWRRGRLEWRRDVVPLLPWFAAGVGAGLFTLWFERVGIGAQGGDFGLDGLKRALLAGRVVWFYLGKLLWPAGLAFFYPRWEIDAAALLQWLFPLTALAALGLAAWWARRDRGPLAAALLYGGTLVPVLGFVNVYPFVFSYVADHFQYQASLGMIAFLVAVAVRGFARLRAPRWAGPALAAVVVAVLGGLTWRQSAIYRDVFALYTATLARNPASWVANLNLGVALADAGQPVEALPYLRRAEAFKPDFPETLNSLGNVLNQLQRPGEARPLLERAVRLQPRFAGAHNTLGSVLMAEGRAAEGIAAFTRALELDPDLLTARLNLAWAHAEGGRWETAAAFFEQARRRHPGSAEVDFKWGLALVKAGRDAEAVPHFQRGVELQPENVEVRYALGCALLEIRRMTEAESAFEEVLRRDPEHEGAQVGLSIIRGAWGGR